MRKTFGLAVLMFGMVMMMPSRALPEDDVLAKRLAGIFLVIQKICIEEAKIECELLWIADPPKFLKAGESTGYQGVFNPEMPYLFVAVGEYDDMDPDIYLFDSSKNMLAKGIRSEPFEVVPYIPKYRQKIFTGIKLQKGNGRVGAIVMKPVGD